MKVTIKKRWLIPAAAVLAVLILGAVVLMRGRAKRASAEGAAVRTAEVTRQDITATLSASGTLSPKDTYSITSMAEGEVVEAAFEEGDQVTEGQVLYRIDATSMDSRLNSAKNSLERAQESYDSAVEDYNEALSKYSGNTYKSTKAGYIKTLYIEAGDKVSGNTQIADLYNDSVMRIRVPFLNTEAAAIVPGENAILTLSDTLEQIAGVVKSVSSMDETLDGGRLVRYVTIETANPGGLTTTMTATAIVGNFISSGDGTFEPTVDTVLSADLSSSVEVASVLVNEGDYVSVGSALFAMETRSAKDLIDSYKNSMDSAESQLESAQSSLDSTQETYDDYTITAPISGTVVTKNVKVGDNVQNGSSASTLAVIYDLSSLTFQMNIDELDISQVSAGQEVQVTADAFENEVFSGTVTNVSMEGTSSNGVTYYPVTVTLNELGNLLPGMNVDGVIVVDSAEQALAVPADALQRGNVVYVKDDSVAEAQGRVPAGFREVQVETGVINSDYVEIVSGDLQEGDQVYVSESSVSSTNSMMPMGGGNMGGMGGAMGGGNRPGGSSGGGPGGGGPGGSGRR